MRKLKRGMVCILNPIAEDDGERLKELVKKNKRVKVKILRKNDSRKGRFWITRVDGKEFHPEFGREICVMEKELLPISEKTKELVL